jgi:hypothetical protein
VAEVSKPSPERNTSVAEDANVAVVSDVTAMPVSYRTDLAASDAKTMLTSSDAQPQTRDIARAEDPEEIQQRLASLGYYFGSPTAAWGERSREALKAFQKLNELLPTSSWDETTEIALFSSTPRKASSFVGTWAEDENACLTLPAVIRREGARAGSTFCAFGNAKLVEGVWNFAATCSDPTLDGERPTECWGRSFDLVEPKGLPKFRSMSPRGRRALKMRMSCRDKTGDQPCLLVSFSFCRL